MEPAYIAVDVETTGLDLNDEVLEIAVVVLSGDFTIIDHYASVVIPNGINTSEDISLLKDDASQYVQDMHVNNQLWSDMEDSLVAPVRRKEADQEIDDMLSTHCTEPLPLLGSSVDVLDRPMIEKYFPKLAKHITYRSVNVSSFLEIARRTYNIDEMTLDFGHSAIEDHVTEILSNPEYEFDGMCRPHRALYDILVSLYNLPVIVNLLSLEIAGKTSNQEN